MGSAIKKDAKKTRGRPATGVGIQVGTRWSPEIIDQIDKWRKKEADKPARPKAIRRLVELGLKAGATDRLTDKPGQKARAQELAAKTIDKMLDPAAPIEERAQRTRRLTKGPSEFREDRIDLPKAKKK